MSHEEPALQIGDVIDGRYRVISAGIVQDIWTAYTAYDSRRDRLVGVVLLARRLGSGALLLERLARANQAIANLGQAGLVPFEQVGLAGGQLYLVRPHLAGQSLADLLGQVGFLEPEAAVDIAVQVCEALAPVHRAGLLHGSLSPHSIFLGDSGRVVVGDTGLLPALRPEAMRQGQPWGRMPYLSPEQLSGEEAHAASDVYAIGLVLYEMLTGRPPFVAADEASLALQVLRDEPVPLRSRVPQVSPALTEAVHQALAREPAARYRHAGQLAQILRSQMGREQAAATTGSLRPAATGQLVIPPAHHRESYLVDLDAGDWTGDPDRVDWLLIALVVVALAAVLGLIPLWRLVYRTYAAQPDLGALPPAIYRRSNDYAALDTAVYGQGEAKGVPRLDFFGLLWYNLPVEANRERQLENCASLSRNLCRSRGAVLGRIPIGQPPG